MKARPQAWTSLALLEKLVSYPTVSGTSNLSVVGWIEELLGSFDIPFRRYSGAFADRTNLWATIGPENMPGVILSGHLDVVPPSEGMREPFRMQISDGRAYGRGTTDMKGFVACAMRAAMLGSAMELQHPIHLAFSYDEEFGCVGVRDMLAGLADLPIKPALCIVGEPTEMRVVEAHKGKVMGRFLCHGVPGHSSDPQSGVNAIYMAARIIDMARDIERRLASGCSAPGFSVPYTTIHVGTIRGGTALNVIPAECQIAFEIRNAPSDDAAEILREIKEKCGLIATSFGDGARIEVEIENEYPALESDMQQPSLEFFRALAGNGECLKVSYGTEAGLYAQRLGIPTVVCGPGSVAQAHRVNEYVSLEQLSACDGLLERLLSELSTSSNLGR